MSRECLHDKLLSCTDASGSSCTIATLCECLCKRVSTDGWLRRTRRGVKNRKSLKRRQCCMHVARTCMCSGYTAQFLR